MVDISETESTAMIHYSRLLKEFAPKTEIREFNDVRGRCVFAKRDIKRGDIVCLYPICGELTAMYDISTGEQICDDDGLLCDWIVDYKTGHGERKRAEGDIKRYLTAIVVKCTVPNKCRNCTGYVSLPVDETIYMGHLVNDCMSVGSVDDLHKYFDLAMKKCNVANVGYLFGSLNPPRFFLNPNSKQAFLAQVATKEIKTGEELCVYYGPGHWFGNLPPSVWKPHWESWFKMNVAKGVSNIMVQTVVYATYGDYDNMLSQIYGDNQMEWPKRSPW